MMQIEVDKWALDRALTKLGKIEHLERELKPAMAQSLNYMWRRVSREPKKAPGAFSALATAGQRRAYWARVRSNEIDTYKSGGYKRSHVASKSWTQKIESRGGGLEGTLGNNVDYAFYVFTRAGQQKAPFHAVSKWPTVDDVADDSAEQINSFFQRRLEKIIRS